MRGATTVWRLKISRRLKKSPRRLRKVIDWLPFLPDATSGRNLRAEAARAVVRDAAAAAIRSPTIKRAKTLKNRQLLSGGRQKTARLMR